MKVACLGAGYVGAPSSAVMAFKCPHIEVVVLDLSEEKIRAWNSDHLPIFEPGLEEVVKACRGKNLSFSTDLAKHINEADIIFVSVQTPTKVHGIGAGQASDLAAWESAGRAIALYSHSTKIIVEKSTVPVKTAEALELVIRANWSGPGELFVLSNPEFLAEGTAIKDLMEPDRILIGGDISHKGGKRAMKALAELYECWIPPDRILLVDVWSSELSKLAANAFLAQRISSINSIALLCEKSGGSVESVARAIGLDSRIGNKFLNASVGFGGSCFQKDILSLVYIANSLHLTEVAEYWHQVIKMNTHMKKTFVETMVTNLFNTVKGKRLAIFGFAFKKDTGDVRETPAIDVCWNLLVEGAHLTIYDPKVSKDAALIEMRHHGYAVDEYLDRFEFCEEPLQAVEGADAIAILTEWDCFKDYDYAAFHQVMRKPAHVFDGRRLLNTAKLTAMGFHVYQIGKCQSIDISSRDSFDDSDIPTTAGSPIRSA